MNRQEAIEVLARMQRQAAEDIGNEEWGNERLARQECVALNIAIDALSGPVPDPDTGLADPQRQEGCKHCAWIDTSRQHESEDGPVNYCRACGRSLSPRSGAQP